MHPVDEFLALKADIRRLEARAAELRAAFLSGEVPLRSNGAEVVVQAHSRRVLLQSRLPGWVQSDPRLWQTRHLRIVKTRSLQTPGEPDPAAHEPCADDRVSLRRQRLSGNTAQPDDPPLRAVTSCRIAPIPDWATGGAAQAPCDPPMPPLRVATARDDDEIVRIE